MSSLAGPTPIITSEELSYLETECEETEEELPSTFV